MNGRTDPPLDTLRKLVVEHGGMYEQYFTQSRVTHMVCDYLTPKKREEFKLISLEDAGGC